MSKSLASCELLGPHHEVRVLAVRVGLSLLRVRALKYLVSSSLWSILHFRCVRNDYYVKEEKQDGLFQLTGHETVISRNSTPSVNGTSMSHFSGSHRHFCTQRLNGRVGWDGGGWAGVSLVFSPNLSGCRYDGLLKRTVRLHAHQATHFFSPYCTFCLCQNNTVY